MKTRRVVVTGMGALTPIGLNVPTFLEGLKNGVSGANLITRFDASKFKTKFACELKGFEVNNFIDKKEARRMDPFTHYALIVASEAIKDSGMDLSQLNREKIGVVMGSGIGGMQVFSQEVRDFTLGDGTPRFNPFFIPRMIIDIAPGRISIEHGLKGPNYASISACATSTNCIIDAYMLIKMGYADAMVAGGSEAAITEVGIGGFNSMKALSENNDNYQTASRPFDVTRDGFVLGEGGGALILEEYEHAVKRGAKIYAELAGVGMSADAYHITAPAEDGSGAALVMQNCLNDAGLTANEVDYLNMHGTSTPLGDVAETKAIKKVFGEAAYQMNVSSTKSMVGHLLGAAGVVEGIASVLAIQHSFIPPTINHVNPDPDCDLNYTFNQAQYREVNVAMSNTFGFGGHNACVLFKKI
ncbi:MAG: beta-ketoacyl-ACP synthase II [Bacteroidia bacterium]